MTTTENPLESTPIKHVNVSNHLGGSNGVKGETTLSTTKHHGNLSQNSTYPREETVGSAQYKSRTTETTQIIRESRSYSDKSETKLESSTYVRKETVGSTQFNNAIAPILESKSDEKNQSTQETATVTIVLRNVSPKSKIFLSLYIFTHSFFYLHDFWIASSSFSTCKRKKIYREGKMHVMWLDLAYKFSFPLTTGDFGYAACEQRKEQELNGI